KSDVQGPFVRIDSDCPQKCRSFIGQTFTARIDLRRLRTNRYRRNAIDEPPRPYWILICWTDSRPMQHTHGFAVPFRFPVLFTQNAWNTANTMFFDVVRREEPDRRHRVLTVVDSEVVAAHSTLTAAIRGYFAAFPDALELVAPPVVVPGGEA